MRNLAIRALTVAIAAALTACAGVQITPISQKEAADNHTGGSPKTGYIVYHPTLLVRVSSEKRCPADKLKDNKCDPKDATLDYCEVSPPQLFPNFARPYRVDAKSGLGKAGVEINISNGWMLATVKDNSDNTALLGELIKSGVIIKGLNAGPREASTCPSGIYEWTDKGFVLFKGFSGS